MWVVVIVRMRTNEEVVVVVVGHAGDIFYVANDDVITPRISIKLCCYLLGT